MRGSPRIWVNTNGHPIPVLQCQLGYNRWLSVEPVPGEGWTPPAPSGGLNSLIILSVSEGKMEQEVGRGLGNRCGDTGPTSRGAG